MAYEVLHGDCREHLKALIARGTQVDAIVTDPPYELNLMSKKWDNTGIAFDKTLWELALQVLKPGGHLLAFSGTRTYHRMVVAIEDAGFEIRDQLAYIFGSGMPKTSDISKAISKEFGTTSEAEKWQGWYAGLKPAHEPVVCAQKPYNVVPLVDDIVILSSLFEGLLWLLSPAKCAEKALKLSLQEPGAALSGSVRWLAAAAHLASSEDQRQQMDTSISPETVSTLVNIATSCSSILDALWNHGSMSTTGTASDMTTELKTLRFYLLEIMPANMLLALTQANGVRCDANTVEKISRGDKSGLIRYLGNFVGDPATTATISAISNTVANIVDLLSPQSQQPSENSVHKPVQIEQTTQRLGRLHDILARTAGMSFSRSLHGNQNTVVEPAWQPLTPELEPIVLARKPLSEKTIAKNVLKHGTGCMNIDECRVPIEGNDQTSDAGHSGDNGRFPANVLHNGSDEVMEEFAKYGERGAAAPVRGTEPSSAIKNVMNHRERVEGAFHADSGTAARFFYCAKASKKERGDSKHPTIKPLELMKYLVRLVTPKGGTVLDIFAGSGTTGEAAAMQGYDAILIEKEEEYYNDILKRMSLYNVISF